MKSSSLETHHYTLTVISAAAAFVKVEENPTGVRGSIILRCMAFFVLCHMLVFLCHMLVLLISPGDEF